MLLIELPEARAGPTPVLVLTAYLRLSCFVVTLVSVSPALLGFIMYLTMYCIHLFGSFFFFFACMSLFPISGLCTDCSLSLLLFENPQKHN